MSHVLLTSHKWKCLLPSFRHQHAALGTMAFEGQCFWVCDYRLLAATYCTAMGGLRFLWLAAVWSPVLGSALDERGDEQSSSREMVHRQLFPIKNQLSHVDKVQSLRRALCKVSQLTPNALPPISSRTLLLINQIYFSCPKEKKRNILFFKGHKAQKGRHFDLAVGLYFQYL